MRRFLERLHRAGDRRANVGDGLAEILDGVDEFIASRLGVVRRQIGVTGDGVRRIEQKYAQRHVAEPRHLAAREAIPAPDHAGRAGKDRSRDHSARAHVDLMIDFELCPRFGVGRPLLVEGIEEELGRVCPVGLEKRSPMFSEIVGVGRRALDHSRDVLLHDLVELGIKQRPDFAPVAIHRRADAIDREADLEGGRKGHGSGKAPRKRAGI